jgi:hypothetical protein
MMRTNAGDGLAHRCLRHVVQTIHHFWATECRPLPKSQDELRSIAPVHKPTWRRWNADILYLCSS